MNESTVTTQQEPKARFVLNATGNRYVIPDLKNSVDENGLTLNPGERIDLLQFYTPQEINRSRGLDNGIKGVKNPDNDAWAVTPGLIILESMDQVVNYTPEKPFAQGKSAGSSFEAARNFADDNLDKLDLQEEKEFEKIKVRNGRR